MQRLLSDAAANERPSEASAAERLASQRLSIDEGGAVDDLYEHVAEAALPDVAKRTLSYQRQLALRRGLVAPRSTGLRRRTWMSSIPSEQNVGCQPSPNSR